MSSSTRVLALSSVIVLSALLAGCSGQGPGRGSYAEQSDPFSCVAASNFSKCRIEREKFSLSPTVRPGRR